MKNPYRYRGYRYDTETGLYYLQSRYYNPEWGRFINANGIIGQAGELLGHNLFAYTKNNPINRSDQSGFQAEVDVEDGACSSVFQQIVTTIKQANRQATLTTRVLVLATVLYVGKMELDNGITRVRYYTNRKGINGIEKDGSIIAAC